MIVMAQKVKIHLTLVFLLMQALNAFALNKSFLSFIGNALLWDNEVPENFAIVGWPCLEKPGPCNETARYLVGFQSDFPSGKQMYFNRFQTNRHFLYMQKRGNISVSHNLVILDEDSDLSIWPSQTPETLRDNSWIIVLSDTEENHVNRIASHLTKCGLNEKLRLDIQLYFVVNAMLFEAYRVSQTTPVQIKEVKHVDQIKDSNWVWKRRNDLLGTNLNVAYVDHKPKSYEVLHLMIKSFAFNSVLIFQKYIICVERGVIRRWSFS